MKLKAQLVKREIAGDTILVPVGETTTKLQGLLTINETGAATWWHFLTQNYGVTMSISQADGDLSLPADSGMTLRHAAAG